MGEIEGALIPGLKIKAFDLGEADEAGEVVEATLENDPEATKEELADVLFVLLVIANEQKIDLDGALVRVLEKYRARDSHRWPRKDEA